MSITSKSGRSARSKTTASITVTVSSARSGQKRQQKKASEERVTLFAHLPLYTRDLGRLSVPT